MCKIALRESSRARTTPRFKVCLVKCFFLGIVIVVESAVSYVSRRSRVAPQVDAANSRQHRCCGVRVYGREIVCIAHVVFLTAVSPLRGWGPLEHT